MKNDELDALTAMAERAKAALPELLMDGRGTFRYRNYNAVPPAEVMAFVTTARDAVCELHEALKKVPRRKVAAKAGSDE